MAPSVWWKALNAPKSARLRLVCFPYAGGGWQPFACWPEWLPADVEIYAIHMPGRGSRVREPALTEFNGLVAAIGSALDPLLDRPLAFFGHSLGGIVSFEVSRWMRRHRHVLPAHLFISGRRSPREAATRPWLFNRDDTTFVAQLRALGGTAPEVLQNPELLEMLLPMLRADVQLSDSYEYRADSPLACGLTVCGATDDEESSLERIAGWRHETTGAFASHLLSGDHFFIHSQRRELLRIICRDLRTYVT
jgi:medium-chain acyl-[acyl-carrier-protein] hydrolase